MRRLFNWIDPLFGLTVVFARLMVLVTAWPGAASVASAASAAQTPPRRRPDAARQWRGGVNPAAARAGSGATSPRC